MKAGSSMSILVAVVAALLLVGATAADSGTWKETVIVPTKNSSSTLAVSRVVVNGEGGALESVRVRGATCIVYTTACIYLGGRCIGAIYRTNCIMVWVVYTWQACPGAANAWAYSPCPGLKYCAIVY
jgi:hypothetical protein